VNLKFFAVEFYGIAFFDNYGGILMEICAMSLKTRLDSGKPVVTVGEQNQWILQCATGIAYLHATQGIVHRDSMLQN
jgi:hypothetical protein